MKDETVERVVNNPFALQSLMEKMESYLEAKRDHDVAHDEYTGMSWGWAGSRAIERKDNALAEFQTRLDEYIDTKVREVLSEVLAEREAGER